MRLVFFGTSLFSVSVLSQLVDRHEVVAVVSQPDRAKNRKGELIYTPTKEFALSKGIPVYQFEKVKQSADELRYFGADIFVTAAYGQILSQEIIDIAKYGIVNVHASLLPKYRGSSPIQTAILNGDKVTGVTIMQTEIGMDSGDILLSREVEIGSMNTAQLSEELAKVGGELLIEALTKIEQGTIESKKQDESQAVNCKKISKEAAEIRWDMTSSEVYNTIRAFNPNPIAYTIYNSDRIKIYDAELADGSSEPGQILYADKKNGLVIACAQGAISVKQLQAPGKKVMTINEFLNGNKLTVGENFGK